MSVERYLVVGAGSIAQRHIGNLRSLFPNAEIILVSASGRSLPLAYLGCEYVFSALSEALLLKPLFAVVASPSTLHLHHGLECLKAGVPVFIEKPPAHDYSEWQSYQSSFDPFKGQIGFSYPLREFPALKRLKRVLDECVYGEIYRVQVEVGQFLPDWRPGKDYQESVSAQRSLGGGALRELSHEIDYLSWLFGNFEKVFCHAQSSSLFNLDVEDMVDAVLIKNTGAVANLQLDFHQREPIRRCKVLCAGGLLEADLMEQTVTVFAKQGQKEVLLSEPDWDKNQSFLQQLNDFNLHLREKSNQVVSLVDAGKVMALIGAMERSIKSKTVVDIEVN